MTSINAKPHLGEQRSVMVQQSFGWRSAGTGVWVTENTTNVLQHLSPTTYDN